VRSFPGSAQNWIAANAVNDLQVVKIASLRAAFLFSFLSTSAALLGAPPAAQGAGSPGSLSTARYGHTSTLLSNGKVLVAGGSNGSYLASAELYDPTSGTWAATGSLNTARQMHTATLLSNGKVLVAGGFNGGTLASAELYDPASGTWAATGSLNTARWIHTATLLSNGKVLVAGGIDNVGNPFASAELYDPASGTWTATGSLNTGRYDHTATLLPNGKVLVAGDLTAISIFPRARNCTTRRAGHGRPRAASTPHAINTRRRCCPMAWCSL
jgi:hypothetical protein